MMYIPKTITTGMIKNQPMLPKQKGVFWRGSNGDVWVKGGKGTNSAGKWDSNTQNYWGSRGYTLIDDPNPPKPSGNGNPDDETPADNNNGWGDWSSSGGSGTDNGYTDLDIASIEATIARNNRLLESLRGGREATLRNIDSEYQNNYRRAMDNQALAKRDLALRARDNEDRKQTNFNEINDLTERRYNSAMRALGIAGAGRSSAAQTVMPTLLAQESGKLRGKEMDTFNRNKESINFAQEETERKYRDLLDDLLYQKNAKLNNAQQGFINNENDILANNATAEAELAYARGGNPRQALNDYNATWERNQAILDALLSSNAAPTYNYQPVNTVVPDTTNYTVDPNAVAMGEQTSDPTAFDINAYLPWLRRQRELGLL